LDRVERLLEGEHLGLAPGDVLDDAVNPFGFVLEGLLVEMAVLDGDA
jgi:hypothetical protein